MRAALLVLLLCGCSHHAPTPAPKPPPEPAPPREVEFKPTSAIWGFAYCEDGISFNPSTLKVTVGPRPVIWINGSVIGTADERNVIVHEQKHAEQMMRYPTCKAYSNRPMEANAEHEAEAFCEDVKLDMLPPRSMTRDAAIAKYTHWMQNPIYRRLGITPESADSLLRRFC